MEDIDDKSNVITGKQRPKRNRERRLYTPSPPPRFGGESKRKRERSDDLSTSTHLQTLPNSKISWAKEPPRQVHTVKPQAEPSLSHIQSSSSQQAFDSSFHFAEFPPVAKVGQSSIPSPQIQRQSSTYGYTQQQTQMQTVQQAQHVVVLLRQNEKLAKEVAQLKRLNQEQQQQIQSLISANRELIWAFNESRREHEELMKQLKSLMASNKAATPTVNSTENIKQVVSKKEEETNQLISEIDHQKKRTKEEEICVIKDELNNLRSNPDSSKFLGLRRPAFFTPNEYGDWHSVISGDLRKQIVLKIFQALCPEVVQKCIDDYNKAYPSRVDYIKKSIDFSFDTENELFVSASSKDVYLGFIAEKIFTLNEAISRFSTTTKSEVGRGEGEGCCSSDSDDTNSRRSNGNNNNVRSRKLADVLKRTKNIDYDE